MLMALFFVPPVGAFFVPKVNVCHCEQPDSESPFQCQTLNIAVPAAIAHLTQHDADYAGVCQEEPVPTPTPTVTPTPTDTPKDYCDTLEGTQAEDEDCPEEQEPTPTPEPRLPDQPLTPAGAGPAPACGNRSIALVPQNFHVLRNGSEAILKWVPTGGDLVNVYYKELGQSSWTHGLGDQTNDGYLVIDHLNPNLGYEFAVQQHEGCGGGELSPKAVVKDPPTAQWTLFQQTSWE